MRFIPITATFASAASATSAVSLSGYVLGKIWIPSGFSATQILIDDSHDFDGTYGPYYYSGGVWSSYVTAGAMNALRITETVNLENVIFRTSATAHPTAVTVTAYVRPL